MLYPGNSVCFNTKRLQSQQKQGELPALRKEQCHPPSSWETVGLLCDHCQTVPALPEHPSSSSMHSRDGDDPSGRLLTEAGYGAP